MKGKGRGVYTPRSAAAFSGVIAAKMSASKLCKPRDFTVKGNKYTCTYHDIICICALGNGNGKCERKGGEEDQCGREHMHIET